jgi:hypothetical protein
MRPRLIDRRMVDRVSDDDDDHRDDDTVEKDRHFSSAGDVPGPTSSNAVRVVQSVSGGKRMNRQRSQLPNHNNSG